MYRLPTRSIMLPETTLQVENHCILSSIQRVVIHYRIYTKAPFNQIGIKQLKTII